MKVSKGVIHFTGSTAAIANAACKRDAISTARNFHHDFMTLLNLKRG